MAQGPDGAEDPAVKRVLDREEDARHATATQLTLDRHAVAQQDLEA